MHTMHTRERNFVFSFIYKGFRAFSGLFCMHPEMHTDAYTHTKQGLSLFVVGGLGAG